MARSLSRPIRQISVLIVLFFVSSCGAIPNIKSISSDLYEPKIFGFRVDSGDKAAEMGENGVPTLLANVNYKLRLYGENFKDKMLISFTDNTGVEGDRCTSFSGAPRNIIPEMINGAISRSIATVDVNLPKPTNSDYFYLCISEGDIAATGRDHSQAFYHQGSEEWLQICVNSPLLPY